MLPAYSIIFLCYYRAIMPTTANLNERGAATSGICLKGEGAAAFSTHLNKEKLALLFW